MVSAGWQQAGTSAQEYGQRAWSAANARRGEWKMDQSMRMVIIAGVLMLALLIAIVGTVSADSVTWHASVAQMPAPATGQQL